LARQSAGEGAADLGSVLVFVFERELKLGPVGDRATLSQVNILLDDLSHPKIAERPCRSPDRFLSVTLEDGADVAVGNEATVVWF
jgi:hypothetical protein